MVHYIAIQFDLKLAQGFVIYQYGMFKLCMHGVLFIINNYVHKYILVYYMYCGIYKACLLLLLLFWGGGVN